MVGRDSVLGSCGESFFLDDGNFSIGISLEAIDGYDNWNTKLPCV